LALELRGAVPAGAFLLNQPNPCSWRLDGGHHVRSEKRRAYDRWLSARVNARIAKEPIAGANALESYFGMHSNLVSLEGRLDAIDARARVRPNLGPHSLLETGRQKRLWRCRRLMGRTGKASVRVDLASINAFY
jgi:hypothetical protein